ncbi:MAG: ABC transporter substrate-binding protein [Gammaproteobacteria bacterium]|nr:ABC transporter substrate-binding protein [Gammaproteobacteria bacterium]MBU2478040.1 ABC transporter substrate-binding protein [Gammaproteobacteria bacterium]
MSLLLPRLLFVSMLIVSILSGCSRPDHDSIRLAIAGDAANLDPRFTTDATSARINRLIYARLVDFDEQTQPKAALASWEQFAPTYYRFHLGSEGRTFHDGTRLTSRDVKATYDFILDPANGSPHRASLALIERIDVVDEDTLDFFLQRPDLLFPGYLVIGILPERLARLAKDELFTPLGSGPMLFLERPSPGIVRLQRQEDGQLIEVVRVPDATVRVLKLMRGEVDLLQNDLPAELITYLNQDPEIQVRRATGSNFAYLGFNIADEDTGKIEVRLAIAHALNRERIIQYVLDEGARPAGALLPPDHWVGHPELKGVAYDPERSRALLAEAGYGPDNPLRLTYKTSSDAVRIRLATVIQSQLAKVGIDVSLKTYDWGTFYGDIKAGRFQLYSLSWVGIKSPDIFRYVFHSNSAPPEGANRGNFQDATVDTLIEAAEQVQDTASQVILYRALQERLLATLPVVPLWYEDQVYATREGINGYVLAQDGNYDGLLTVHHGEP